MFYIHCKYRDVSAGRCPRAGAGASARVCVHIYIYIYIYIYICFPQGWLCAFPLAPRAPALRVRVAPEQPTLRGHRGVTRVRGSKFVFIIIITVLTQLILT